MKKILHILKSEPDEATVTVIDALSSEQGAAAVVSLYVDEVSGTTTNWQRLVDDIFSYDQVICWD